MEYFEKLKTKLGELDLEESTVDELVEFSKKQIPKEWTPGNTYNQKVEELDTFKKELENTKETLDKLKNSTEDIETLKEELSKANTKIENVQQEADTRVARIEKKSMFKDALLKNNADPDFVDLIMMENEDKIDEMKIDEENNTIIGQDDYINSVKEKRSKAFLKDKVDTPEPKESDGEVDEQFADIDAAMGL